MINADGPPSPCSIYTAEVPAQWKSTLTPLSLILRDHLHPRLASLDKEPIIPIVGLFPSLPLWAPRKMVLVRIEAPYEARPVALHDGDDGRVDCGV